MMALHADKELKCFEKEQVLTAILGVKKDTVLPDSWRNFSDKNCL